MNNKIIGIIVIIFGIIIMVWSVGNFKVNDNKQKTYIETTATIVDYEECEMDDTMGTRFIAEYKVDRSTYQIKENGCSNVPIKTKKTVKIKYNPSNPEDAVFANDISHYLLPAVGAIFAACGIILIRKKS